MASPAEATCWVFSLAGEPLSRRAVPLPAALGEGELLVRLESTPTEVAIHVIDTGPGIPVDRHREIFRPYVSGRRGGLWCSDGVSARR